MQTTTADTTKCPSHGPFCVDCRHCADFGFDIGRVCLLPATTTTDPVTGGQVWPICEFARSADNAHCGPMGLGFAPRSIRSAQQTHTTATGRLKSWLTSATRPIGDWLAALHRPHPSQESQSRPHPLPCAEAVANCGQRPAGPRSSSAEPTSQQQSTRPIAPTRTPATTGEVAPLERSGPAGSPAPSVRPSTETKPACSSSSTAPGGCPCACAPSRQA